MPTSYISRRGLIAATSLAAATRRIAAYPYTSRYRKHGPRELAGPTVLAHCLQASGRAPPATSTVLPCISWKLASRAQNRPAILLLHGFPELAYSWRKVILPLASAGYHVIAPDRRGHGRTIGWDDAYDADLSSLAFFKTSGMPWRLSQRSGTAR